MKKSRYYLKRRGVVQRVFQARSIRRCDNCQRRLPGKKGHGWIDGGRRLLCGDKTTRGCAPA